MLRNQHDRIWVLSLIDKDTSKETTTEVLAKELSRLNIKAELLIKEKEGEESESERLLKELNKKTPPFFHFLVISRTGFSRKDECGFALGRTAESLVNSFQGNLVIT